MKYILKNGQQIESIDIGKANIKIGQRNNRLTICDRAPNTKSKKARVICLCDCGQYTVINHQDFKNGQVKSCGCYAKEIHAEIGRKTAIDFTQSQYNNNPFYEYIEPTDVRFNWSKQVVWKVKCRKCNKEYLAIPKELISINNNKRMNPCNCWKTYSIGVQRIITILEKNNISYELEKKFDTCISPKGNYLPFDFYLPDYKILIEYDGQQHFNIAFGQNENKLIQQKKYDKIKNEWCKNNNIHLIRIPYYQKEITIQNLIGEKING